MQPKHNLQMDVGDLLECREFASLSKEQRAILDRLENYDISFVINKLTTDGRIPEARGAILAREFKRFMALAGFGICPLAMISPLVDEVWHQFILFTKQYREFCHKTVGGFIGHLPDTVSTPVPVVAGENFRSGYRRYFGKIPDIWYERMTEETKRYYLQPILLGKPPTSWSGWVGPE